MRESREVALFADTFNTYFEPENLHAAVEVLTRLGYRVDAAGADGTAPSARAPLCCGRTFLSAGLVEEARAEARRVLAAAAPLSRAACPSSGLEPSCLLTLRDEFLSMLPGAEAERLASHALLLRGVPRSAKPLPAASRGRSRRHEAQVLLHGHCHQKAFGVMAAVETDAGAGRGPEVETVEIELLRHGRRIRLRRRHATRLDGHGRSCRCCRPSARRRRTPSSPPTASPAATRSRRHRPRRPSTLPHPVRGAAAREMGQPLGNRSFGHGDQDRLFAEPRPRRASATGLADDVCRLPVCANTARRNHIASRRTIDTKVHLSAGGRYGCRKVGLSAA